MADNRSLIDANAFIKFFEKAKKIAEVIPGELGNILRGLYDEVIEEIKKQPTVDAVEVVHGRWRNEFVKGIRGVFGEVFVCSECKTRYLIPNMNYCPNCGAKMDGDGNG